MNKKECVIFGISDLAKMLYILSKDMDNMNIIAFMADDEYCTNDTFCGLPVWKYSTLDTDMISTYDFLMCVGYRNMRSRQKIYERLVERGCVFINFIHPTVTILPEVSIGSNNIILSNVTIENCAQIGNNNVFWTQAIIGHNAVVHDHNFFAANVTIGGNCIINNLCFFGISVFLINNLKIDDETFIVAGSGLFTDTKKNTKYWGNPAKKVGSHELTGIII